MPATKAAFMCTECKHRARGTPGDEYKRSCDRCGGQLVRVKFGPQRRRKR